MSYYSQGFIDKCAESGVDVGDVISFLVPILGASAVGAMFGLPVGIIRRDMTAGQGMLSGAAVGAGAGIGKQLAKKLVTPLIVKKSAHDELVKNANLMNVIRRAGESVASHAPNVVAGTYDDVVAGLRKLLFGGKKGRGPAAGASKVKDQAGGAQ